MRWNEITETEEFDMDPAEMDKLITDIENKNPDDFTYVVYDMGNKFIVVEQDSNIIVHETTDEDEADALADHFNADKDEGKDALVHSLYVNQRKYNLDIKIPKQPKSAQRI